MPQPTRPAPAADQAAIAAFEARMREVGESPARLENIASLVVELLEARRDHKIEKRLGATEAA
jgi:hypothetical protein